MTTNTTRFGTLLQWVQELRLSEIKVIAAIALETESEDWQEIRLAELVKLTGLKVAAVARATAVLEERGYLKVRREHRDGFSAGKLPNMYRIRWELE